MVKSCKSSTDEMNLQVKDLARQSYIDCIDGVSSGDARRRRAPLAPWRSMNFDVRSIE